MKKNIRMSEILIIVLIGVLAGIFSGFIGIGGGLIIVPALVFFMAFSQHAAQGTSLAMMLPPIGILAVYNYYKSGFVDIKISLFLAMAFIIGGFIGSKIAIGLPAETVKKVFGVFIILIGIKMIFWK